MCTVEMIYNLYCLEMCFTQAMITQLANMTTYKFLTFITLRLRCGKGEVTTPVFSLYHVLTKLNPSFSLVQYT